MTARTIVIGDIHGQFDHLRRLWGRLPAITEADTVVFLGDYIDRGAQSREVIEFVRGLSAQIPARIVTLMGNHERMLLDAYEKEMVAPLLPPPNGCLAAYLSLTGEALAVNDDDKHEQLLRRLKVREWLPPSIYDWLTELQLWYEDEHAIYVHAGLEGEGKVWSHPTQSQEGALLWMREDDFWKGYSGKRLVFGHTVTTHLPTDHLNWLGRQFDDPGDVWIRGDLIGVDTGCGKGGFLSAVVLPSLDIYESR